MRTVHVITYGCQMNEHDSEMILGVMEDAGYVSVASPEDADVVLLNTCCVRAKPERKVVGKVAELAQLRKQRPGLVIGVCGCMGQSLADALFTLVPQADLVTGPDAIGRLPALVREVECGRRHISDTDLSDDCPASLLPKSRQDDLKAWITIVHGCTNFCSYCIVPSVRGPERSRSLAEIVREAEELAGLGIVEIRLLGQNVNCYGRDLGASAPRFAELLRALNEVPGLRRIRFTTSHPRDFTDDIIEAVAESENVCEHIHLPIQSGDSDILAQMNRGYSVEDYCALVDRIREAVPECSITTDVMVAFPGETEDQFRNTLAAFERVRFDQAFMFIFSPRRGTRAAAMLGAIDKETGTRRLQELAALQNSIAREKNQAVVGRSFEVLVEGPSERDANRMVGRTRTHKIAVFDPTEHTARGSFITMRATKGFLWGFESEAMTDA